MPDVRKRPPRNSPPSNVEDNGDETSPAISHLTTPSTPSTQRRRDVHRIEEVNLADLAADSPITPVKRLDFLQQELQYDLEAYAHNPGASDSEDEDEDEDGVGMLMAA